jgi:hypothetical protein
MDRSRPASILAPELPLWEVYLPDGRWTFVRASDRSQASAEAKRQLGVHDRLPSGTTLELL